MKLKENKKPIYILKISQKENPKIYTRRKSEDLDHLRKVGKDFTRFNDVRIYDTKRNLIETIK